MKKKRLIPVLLLRNGFLVQSKSFSRYQNIGNPLTAVKRLSDWASDELIYLDITRDDTYDLRRDDHKIRGLSDPLAILDAVSKTCFMPLTWGGRIRIVEDMKRCFSKGADKITVNSAAVREPELIFQGAKLFGSQAMVVSIDARRYVDGTTEVFIDGGRTATGLKPQEWAKEAEARGAGEILLQSIDRDGTGCGYDLDLIQSVVSVTTIPVIACGGVGSYEHYVGGIEARL